MAGTEVMTIANLNEMEARVDIGEVDVILIAVGQRTRLEVDAFRDRKFTGTVTEIANAAKGPAGASSSSSSSSMQSQEATKFEVKIRVHEKEPFRPGMSVTAEIETRYRTNVLTVPIQSVTTRLPKGTNDAKASNPGDKKRNNPSKQTNTGTDTNTTARGDKRNGASKPIEVVFLLEGERVKQVPVKRGISDDAYVEITEGLQQEQEVVSGGYKAINRELEDGKKIKRGTPEPEGEEKEN
jgi:HlyD family secretion protein